MIQSRLPVEDMAQCSVRITDGNHYFLGMGTLVDIGLPIEEGVENCILIIPTIILTNALGNTYSEFLKAQTCIHVGIKQKDDKGDDLERLVEIPLAEFLEIEDELAIAYISLCPDTDYYNFVETIHVTDLDTAKNDITQMGQQVYVSEIIYGDSDTSQVIVRCGNITGIYEKTLFYYYFATEWLHKIRLGLPIFTKYGNGVYFLGMTVSYNEDFTIITSAKNIMRRINNLLKK